MAMFHWTYLNEDYDQAVYKVWKQQGCYEDVHRLLGYRLTIEKVGYSWHNAIIFNKIWYRIGVRLKALEILHESCTETLLK